MAAEYNLQTSMSNFGDPIADRGAMTVMMKDAAGAINQDATLALLGNGRPLQEFRQPDPGLSL